MARTRWQCAGYSRRRVVRRCRDASRLSRGDESVEPRTSWAQSTAARSSMSAQIAEPEPERGQLTQKIRALGDWFHNIEIDGVQTAPSHFLGDYPRVKWDRFQNAIPLDLRGKTVLDIGCNAGFYSIEM